MVHERFCTSCQELTMFKYELSVDSTRCVECGGFTSIHPNSIKKFIDKLERKDLEIELLKDKIIDIKKQHRNTIKLLQNKGVKTK